MYAINQSPLMQELIAQHSFEWVPKGRVEGRIEGEFKGTLTSLRETLTLRFKANWDELAIKLAPLSFNAIKELFKVAVTANTLNEFEQALAEVISQQATPEDK